MKPVIANTLLLGGATALGVSCLSQMPANSRGILTMLSLVLEFILAWAILREGYAQRPKMAARWRFLETLLPLGVMAAALARGFGVFGPSILT